MRLRGDLVQRRPAEYSSEFNAELAAVMTTKNTSAEAQLRPAYWNTMMNGEANEPSSLAVKLRHGTMAMIATSAPT